MLKTTSTQVLEDEAGGGQGGVFSEWPGNPVFPLDDLLSNDDHPEAGPCSSRPPHRSRGGKFLGAPGWAAEPPHYPPSAPDPGTAPPCPEPHRSHLPRGTLGLGSRGPWGFLWLGHPRLAPPPVRESFLLSPGLRDGALIGPQTAGHAAAPGEPSAVGAAGWRGHCVMDFLWLL